MMDFSTFLQENFPAVLCTVIFFLVIPWGRNVWIAADTLITISFAVMCIFFPAQYLNYEVNGVVDGIHLHMLRMLGLILLSTSLFACCVLVLKDETVKTTVLWGRVIGISIFIMARVHSHLHIKTGTKWDAQAFHFAMYGDSLWLLGNLIYAIKSTDMTGAKASHGRVDFFLQIDFVQTFLFAFLFFVFPGHMLGFQCKENLRGLHMCTIRMFAAFIFNSAIISGRAPNFPSLSDKTNFLTCRLITNAMLVTAQMYTQLTTDYWTKWHVYFGMIGISVWSINAAMGYFRALQANVSKPESKKD